MADLNSLLRWSIENSASTQSTSTSSTTSQPLSLSFKPAQTPSNGTSALHPSDPQLRLDDVSPASTPGPLTPTEGSSQLPNLPKGNGELTTDILDVIMGKSDSVTMREKMEFAVDESNSVEDRVAALDDFEMLIELIDNANNMAVLKMWQPLLGLLSSPEPEIVTNAVWIIGTAVQNNLKAQAALYIHEALPLILSLIYPASGSPSGSLPPNSVRSKATYAFSGAIKHWPLASPALSSNDNQGWTTLKRGVADSNPTIRRKMAFLTNTLVLQSDETYTGEIPGEVKALIEEKMSGSEAASLLEGLQDHGVLQSLVDGLQMSEDDLEYEENAIRALSAAASKKALSDEQLKRVQGVWRKWGAAGREERGITGDDTRQFDQILAC